MASKKVTNRTQSAILILIILGFLAVINYAGTKLFVRQDLTEGKEYSISPASKKMLKSLDDIINIKVYFSKNLPPNARSLESGIKDLLAEFKAYSGGNLRITWNDPADDEEMKKEVRGMGIPEVQVQSFEKDKAQAMNVYMGIAILYGDKKEVLPVIQDLRNLEYDLAQAIMKVGRSVTPKVGLLKTDTMPSVPPQVAMRMNMKDPTEEKFSRLLQALRQNYEVTTVDISRGEEIDTSIKTLIIPGGDESSYTTRDLFEIDQFFMKGGNIIACIDAIAINFQYGVNAVPQEPRIMHLLEHYGARVEKQLVLDASCGQVQIPQKFGQFTMNVPVSYPFFVRVSGDGFNKQNPAVSGLGEAVFPWCSPVTVLSADTSASQDTAAGKVKSTVLFSSSAKSWTQEAGSMNLMPQQEWGQIFQQNQEHLKAQSIAVHLSGSFTSYFAGKSVPPVHEPEPGDTGALAGINLDGKDLSREIVAINSGRHLVVAGDADFISDQNASASNLSLILNLTDWLTLDNNLIGIRSRTLVDRTIQNDQLQKGSNLPNFIRFLNILLMPIALIIVGLVIFMVRRGKDEAAPSTGTSAMPEKENK
jgi:gliding-associated putative ABC transporter substrate-binding component GldG